MKRTPWRALAVFTVLSWVVAGVFIVHGENLVNRYVSGDTWFNASMPFLLLPLFVVPLVVFRHHLPTAREIFTPTPEIPTKLGTDVDAAAFRFFVKHPFLLRTTLAALVISIASQPLSLLGVPRIELVVPGITLADIGLGGYLLCFLRDFPFMLIAGIRLSRDQRRARRGTQVGDVS